jgi:hypothetical protein
MPGIRSNHLSLQIDGKTVELKTMTRRNLDLNKALLDPAEFKKFAADPQEFAKQYDLNIDPHISAQLASRLSGVGSITDIQRITTDGGESGATAWAVAHGAYSIASTKIAVAF